MSAPRSTRYHPEEADWRDYHHYLKPTLPEQAEHWLLDRGSLTQRLIKASNNRFSVSIVQQGWQRPRLSEAALLEIPQGQRAIIREVLLLCDGQPWVFARSVMPVQSLTGRLRRLRQFKNSSLGELLFRDPSMRRGPFQISQIDGDSGQLPARVRSPGLLWGRRCRFELSGKPIMVSEIFLRDFRV